MYSHSSSLGHCVSHTENDFMLHVTRVLPQCMGKGFSEFCGLDSSSILGRFLYVAPNVVYVVLQVACSKYVRMLRSTLLRLSQLHVIPTLSLL